MVEKKQKLISILVIVILTSCGENKPKLIHPDSADSTAPIVQESLTTQKAGILNLECSYDNEVSDLGSGLVIAPAQFTIYNDSLLQDKLASRDMYLQDTLTDICSKFFKPDYGIMHFACVGETSNAYKVLINFSQVKFLPKEKEYKLLTWEQYILSSYGIRRVISESGELQDSSQRLYKKPDDSSDTLKVPNGYEMFCPLQIQGDWVLVKYDCFYNSETSLHESKPCHNYISQCKNPVTGWLRWRQENKLLIEILLMP